MATILKDWAQVCFRAWYYWLWW